MKTRQVGTLQLNISEYLKDCVFYPCSCMHGLPVKLLAEENRFKRFFYVDYGVNSNQFSEQIAGAGFKGYQLTERIDLTPEHVFGASWSAILAYHRNMLQDPELTWPTEPYVVLARFQRQPAFPETHGPAEFELLFACCEGIAAYHFAFASRAVSPSCLVYIRPGLAFGGCFPEFPNLLTDEVRHNSAKLPKYMLHGDDADNPNGYSHFNLLADYIVPPGPNPLKPWGLTLRHRIRDRSRMRIKRLANPEVGLNRERSCRS